ncbi:alpha/beta fold hydrolase [Myxococcus qinghaiensis]|uniref:hypothetical protein n=1 Tax=Myxococcus qinghaiensis TaxID=2906758 RepID=UPI0020A73ABD|nr:hypothetical protein [Myxococcus qinghaiensis]MCP3166795.1 hypothetical protein [Myxococcus qinghaiensis]
MSPIDRNRPASTPLASTQTSRTALKNPLGGLVEAAKNGLKEVPRFLEQGKDVFESTHLSEIKKLFGGDSKPDRTQDGKLMGAKGQTFAPGTPLKDIPGVTPQNNPNPSKTILYVNGIMTPAANQLSEMKSIAEKADARVIGIHNATQGIVADLAQCVGDKLDKGTNPAVDTLADTVYGELKAGREVHLMGYSQGGLITARALFDVERRLRIEDGLSPAQVEKAMSKLSVETFGAASTKYPDGPKYVHYINNADAVPTLTGLGGSFDPVAFAKDAGKGAVVHRFTDGNLNLIGNHMLDTMYMKHRVPFDEARAGNF